MLQRISGGNDEKYPKSCIDAKNHLLILGLVRIPPPSGRPPRHHERINTHEENQPKNDQCHSKKTYPCFEIHASPLCMGPWERFGVSVCIAPVTVNSLYVF